MSTTTPGHTGTHALRHSGAVTSTGPSGRRTGTPTAARHRRPAGQPRQSLPTAARGSRVGRHRTTGAGPVATAVDTGPTPVTARRRRLRRRHPLAGLGVVALGLALFGGLWSAAFGTPASASSTDGTAAQVAMGKTLFVNNCASCHGLNGAGQKYANGTIIGPSLIGVGSAAVDFQVMTGRMPAAGQGPQIEKHRVMYSQAESDAMAAYVASLGPGPSIPGASQYDPAGLTPTQIANGGELFRTNCAQCHGAAAGGGALSGGKYAPKIEVGPVHIYEAMQTGPQSMPVFADSTLTPMAKRQIIGYLAQLKARPNQGGTGLGRLGTVTEGLAGWVAGIGALIAVAIWLGVKGVRA